MTPASAPGAIRLDGVTFGFPTRDGGVLPVLDGIDLAIPDGGVVALIENPQDYALVPIRLGISFR